MSRYQERSMDSVISTDNDKINIMTGNGKKAVRTFFSQMCYNMVTTTNIITNERCLHGTYFTGNLRAFV